MSILTRIFRPSYIKQRISLFQWTDHYFCGGGGGRGSNFLGCEHFFSIGCSQRQVNNDKRCTRYSCIMKVCCPCGASKHRLQKGLAKNYYAKNGSFFAPQSHGNAYYVDYCKEVRPSVLGISYQEGRIKKAEVFQIQMSHTYCLTTKARLTDHYFLRGAGEGCAVSKKNSAQQKLLEKQSTAEKTCTKNSCKCFTL